MKLELSSRSRAGESLDLMSSDMRREAERRQWEEQEEASMAAEKEGPIHYADIRNNGGWSGGYRNRDNIN